MGECSGASGSVVVPVSILCIQQSTGCLWSLMGALKKKDSWTKLLKYLIVLSQRPQSNGMLSLASTEFRKKRKTNACQHLRIGTFHMKTWISGFSRKTIRSSLARPRVAHSHSGLELRIGCKTLACHSLHHSLSLTSFVHSHFLFGPCKHLLLHGLCFTTTNFPSKISEKLSLSFSSFVTLGKLLLFSC